MIGQTTTAVIQFSAEDYGTEKPYAYLYSIKDRFRQRMEIERIRQDAKLKKVGGMFDRMWREYLATNGASKEVYRAEKTASLTDMDFQPKTGEEYEVTDDGVVAFAPDGFGTIQVCAHPIIPFRRIVNIDTGEYKVELAFRRRGNWRYVIFDKAVLASAQKIVSLASCGIAVDSENARMLVTYLTAIENLNYDKIPEVWSVGRLGWVKDHGFSPYVDGLMFDGNEQYRHAFEAVRPSGDEETWLGLAREVRAGQSIAVRVMLAASFASALVGPLNALPFMVHCWSNVAGIGKTVGLMLAASVWANPEAGSYVRTFNSTSVGLEMMAGFCGSLPLCIDELCLKDGRRDQFDSMIYSYCEGVGRTRGSRNGGLQRTLTWKNCAISTGEEPLTSGNSKAGAVNRVLDIAAGDARMFQDPRAAVALITRHYGHAGKHFVECMTDEELEKLKARQSEIAQAMDGKATDKQILSASLVLTADEWVTEHYFHDGRALTIDEMLPMLQTPTAANINRRCYEWLIDTVSANPGRFEPREDGSYAGECWGVTEWDEKQVYIIKSIFDRLLNEEGYNPKGFLQWAGREGILKRDGRHSTVKKTLGDGRILRCVCIRIRDEEEEEDEKDNPDGFTPVMDETLPF